MPGDGRERAFPHSRPLRAAFFDLHLNSTDGSTVFALDIVGKRLVRLSPNYAEPFPLPGEAGVPGRWRNSVTCRLATVQHTVNCSYVEHWDARVPSGALRAGKSGGPVRRGVDVPAGENACGDYRPYPEPLWLGDAVRAARTALLRGPVLLERLDDGGMAVLPCQTQGGESLFIAGVEVGRHL